MGVETLNYILALGTIGMLIGAIVLLIGQYARLKILEPLLSATAEWGLQLGLLISLAGSALSLYYSEIIGFPPCPLCWWQRVFLYPQVILFAIATWRRDSTIALYSGVLSLLGLGVGLYHHMLQVLPSGSLPCPAEGAVSCGQRLVFEFGFITIPMMAVSLFALLIAVMLVVGARR